MSSEKGGMEPHKIPAANIDGLDLRRISERSSDDVLEIVRIGKLIGEGRETDADTIRLGELLYTHGETRRSEELLRHNIVRRGDAIHETYLRLYDLHAERTLDSAIVD